MKPKMSKKVKNEMTLLKKVLEQLDYENRTGKPYGPEQEYAKEIAEGKVRIVKSGEVVDLGNGMTLIGG